MPGGIDLIYPDIGRSFVDAYTNAQRTKLAEAQEARALQGQQLERDQLAHTREQFLFNVEQKKAEREAEKAKAEAEGRARLQAWGAQEIQAHPERAEFVVKTLHGKGAAPDYLSPDMSPSPETIQRFVAEAGGAAAMTGLDPEKTPKVDTTDFLTNLRGVGIDPQSEQGQRLLLDHLKKNGGVNINMGNSDLEGKAKGDAQNYIAEGEQLLADLADLRSLGDPGQYLGLGSKAKNFTLSGIASIAPGLLSQEQLDQLGRARQFAEGVDQIYLKAKKDVTGVSAGERELTEIRAAVLNRDMNSPEFKASMDKLERVTKRNMEIKRRLLAEGIDLKSARGRQRFGQEIEKDSAAAEPKAGSALGFSQADADAIVGGH